MSEERTSEDEQVSAKENESGSISEPAATQNPEPSPQSSPVLPMRRALRWLPSSAPSAGTRLGAITT